MSLKSLLSFSTGELDPVLHDAIGLEKFRKGLATARNVCISKTGSILSRFSRAHVTKSRNDGEKIKIFAVNGQLLEWGPLYVKNFRFDNNPITRSTSFTAEHLENIQFIVTGNYVYAFVFGQPTIRFDYINDLVELADQAFSVTERPTLIQYTGNFGPPTGYEVEYYVTVIINGEESVGIASAFVSTVLLPESANHNNQLSFIIAGTGVLDDIATECRVYRRPVGGAAFGYIGSSSDFYDNAGIWTCRYKDFGNAADFTNGPPSKITIEGLNNSDIEDLNGRTGAIYQGRLLLTTDIDEEAIVASRPVYKNNFYRDFPYGADSALLFKSGSSGRAKVLRMIESDGLIVFTTEGVFVSSGLLTIDNLALERKGSWIIKKEVPPLLVPGGVFFVDEETNAVRQLIFSRDIFTYEATDHTIFSEHLFREKTIVSWAYQGGKLPVIIVVFSDGTWATFTYNFEHKMRAWTRHDSTYPVEYVVASGEPDSTFFVVNKDGNRYIDVSLPRFIPADVFESNPEADKLNLTTLMDSIETTQNLLNDDLSGSDVFTLTPLVADTWDGELTLDCGTSAVFPSGGLGDVGTVFKHFSTVDKSAVELTITARASDNSVTVQTNSEFPSAQASGFRLYETFNTITGLDHLEGESVSVVVDGGVVCSPNNDEDPYPTVTVSSGSITLPNSLRGAIILVGRPVVSDVQSLNVATVAQSSTKIESIISNRIYTRVHNTRGLYVNGQFPEEKTGDKDGSSVDGMYPLYKETIEDIGDIIVNKPLPPVSKRIEHDVDGMWDIKGQVSYRQVDPVHFEILSIMPDIEVLRRDNRS